MEMGYERGYTEVFHSGLVGKINTIIHRQLEKFATGTFQTVLELGAGAGQHFEHVKCDYEVYIESDVEEKLLRPFNPFFPRLTQMKLDAHDLRIFKDNSIDRIVSYCLLIHLEEPEIALKEWKRVLDVSGQGGGSHLSFYIPCEPGLLLRLLRFLVISRKSKKLGHDNYSFHYKEHITYFLRLDHLIQEIYAEAHIKKRFWPFIIPFWNANLGVFYDIFFGKDDSKEKETESA